MSDNLLERTKEIVIRAAKLADTNSIEIKDKGTLANIVTTADVNVQNFLCKELSNLISDSAFYCEEEGKKETEGEYIWVIDPIDGTMNFSRGLKDFCISVGLVHNKEILLGVVYLPAKGELFTAQVGVGAYLNGKPIHVSNRPYKEALLCTAASTYRKEYGEICFDIIQDVYYKINDFRRIGSCAQEVCYLAAGMCDIYFEFRINPWDYAGAWAVLKTAGGYLCGLGEEKLTFDRPTVLIGANSKENLDKLSDTISKYVPSYPKDYF